MKRYFNVLLLILIIFCYCTFNIKLFAISNTIIENVLGTNLNSFGSAYIPEGKYQNSHSDMDIYEFNDTYDDAIKLNPINYYEVNKYHSNLNGTLDYMASLQDIDYYYFNILTDSCVVLTIETESSSPYTFALMKIEYDEVLNNEANHSLENVIYDQTSSNYKSYSDYIAPGTYYVYVRGLQTSYSVIDYEVNLYVEKTPNSSDAYINVMKNVHQLKGAVWISDFVPANNVSLFELTDDILYYDDRDSDLYYPDYALNDLMGISNGDGIKVACYYIWDPVVRHVLSEVLLKFRNIVHDAMVANEQIRVELMLEYNQASNVLNLMTTIVGMIPIFSTISIPVGLITDISLSVLQSLIDSIVPPFTVAQGEYLAFLSTLVEALNYGINDESKKQDEDFIRSLPDDEVIMIPLYYNIYEEISDELGVNQRYYSMHATCSKFFEYDTFTYSSDLDPINIIYANQIDNYYCRGKIYGIQEYSDINNLMELQLVEDMPTHTHQYDNYEWLNSTMHYATCDCGEYITQGHAVYSGNTRCSLCGGNADMGFIGGMSLNTNKISKNGSVLLSNGVVIIKEEDIELYIKGELLFYSVDTIYK